MVMGATYEKKGCKTIVKKIWKVFKITFASVKKRALKIGSNVLANLTTSISNLAQLTWAAFD